MGTNIIEIKTLIMTAEKSTSKRVSKKPQKDSFTDIFFNKIEEKFKKISN